MTSHIEIVLRYTRNMKRLLIVILLSLMLFPSARGSEELFERLLSTVQKFKSGEKIYKPVIVKGYLPTFSETAVTLKDDDGAGLPFATFDQWEDTLNPRADYAIGEVYAVGSNYGYDALFVNTEEGTIAVGGSRGYPKYKETDCSGQPYLYPYRGITTIHREQYPWDTPASEIQVIYFVPLEPMYERTERVVYQSELRHGLRCQAWSGKEELVPAGQYLLAPELTRLKHPFRCYDPEAWTACDPF